jgi:hypothetical protein
MVIDKRESLLMFREEYVLARAKQILGVEGNSRSTIKNKINYKKELRFAHSQKYHPDKRDPSYTEQAKVLIEAYNLLAGRVKPLDCKLL